MTATGPAGRRVGAAALRLGFGLALLTAIIIVLGPSWTEVRARLAWTSWGIAVSVLASTTAAFASAGRWKLLNERTGGTRVAYGSYFHHLVFARLLAQFLPAILVDLVGRTVGLRNAGSQDSAGRIATTVVLERTFDLILPLGLLGWALVWANPAAARPYPALACAGAVVLVAALAIVTLRPLVTIASRIYGRLRRHRSGKFEIDLVGTLSWAVRAAIVGLGTARYLALVVQYWGMGVVIGVSLTALDILAATPLAQLTALIAITPGGLGFQEGGWAAALAWREVDAADISLFLIATRLGMVFNFGVLSLATLPWRSAPKSKPDPQARS